MSNNHKEDSPKHIDWTRVLVATIIAVAIVLAIGLVAWAVAYTLVGMAQAGKVTAATVTNVLRLDGGLRLSVDIGLFLMGMSGLGYGLLQRELKVRVIRRVDTARQTHAIEANVNMALNPSAVVDDGI